MSSKKVFDDGNVCLEKHYRQPSTSETHTVYTLKAGYVNDQQWRTNVQISISSNGAISVLKDGVRCS